MSAAACEPVDGTLAVIPARAGSKRLPGKNLRLLGGRSLVQLAVDTAIESGLFSRIVVSTDNGAIAAAAQRAGAEVPFLRESALADDLTPVSAATVDMLVRLDPTGDRYASVAQLMPTCPLRTAEDIRTSYRQFVNANAEVQLSVSRYGVQSPWWAMRLSDAMVLRPLYPMQVTARSQDLPELFCPTGAVWWARAATLRSARTFHVEGRTGWEIPWPRGLDIDTEDDWRLAAILMTAGRLADTYAQV